MDDKIQEFGENKQNKPKKVKRVGPVNKGKLYKRSIFLKEAKTSFFQLYFSLGNIRTLTIV